MSLGLPPMRDCRQAMAESIDWFQATGHIGPRKSG
jgi:hypothetical protein